MTKNTQFLKLNKISRICAIKTWLRNSTFLHILAAISKCILYTRKFFINIFLDLNFYKMQKPNGNSMGFEKKIKRCF